MSEFSEGMAVGQSLGNNNGFNDNWWILLLLLCGWGNNGWNNGGANQNVGYELGRLATTNDVASGFSTNTLMANQRESQLAMQGGFANVQQTLCQGFGGINQTISDCCCTTNRNIDNVRFEMSRGFCDVAGAIHAEGEATRALITSNAMQALRDKLEDKDRELLAANFQLSQQAQNAYLVGELRPTSKPAYVTCSPYEAARGWNGPCGGGCCHN